MCDSVGTRTQDFFIKSEELYQLSYEINCGDKQIRTADTCIFSAVLYQLSYITIGGSRWTRTTEPKGADLQSAVIAAIRYFQL